MNQAKNFHGGSGIQTAALAFGGATFPSAVVIDATESYDGTTWSNTAALATKRRIGGPATNTGERKHRSCCWWIQWKLLMSIQQKKFTRRCRPSLQLAVNH